MTKLGQYEEVAAELFIENSFTQTWMRGVNYLTPSSRYSPSKKYYPNIRLHSTKLMNTRGFRNLYNAGTFGSPYNDPLSKAMIALSDQVKKLQHTLPKTAVNGMSDKDLVGLFTNKNTPDIQTLKKVWQDYKASIDPVSRPLGDLNLAKQLGQSAESVLLEEIALLEQMESEHFSGKTVLSYSNIVNTVNRLNQLKEHLALYRSTAGFTLVTTIDKNGYFSEKGEVLKTKWPEFLQTLEQTMVSVSHGGENYGINLTNILTGYYYGTIRKSYGGIQGHEIMGKEKAIPENILAKIHAEVMYPDFIEAKVLLYLTSEEWDEMRKGGWLKKFGKGLWQASNDMAAAQKTVHA